jgi:hypothetical protein
MLYIYLLCMHTYIHMITQIYLRTYKQLNTGPGPGMFLTEPSLSSLASWVASFVDDKRIDNRIDDTKDAKNKNTKNNDNNKGITGFSSDQSQANASTPLTLFFPLSVTSMIIPPLSCDTLKVIHIYICIYIDIYVHTNMCRCIFIFVI